MTFKKGQSGNPNGRKPAIASVNEFRASLAPTMPLIIKKLTDMALEGDTAAIKLLLDRTYPAIKPQALPVNIHIGETMSQTGNNVINTTLAGNIPPDIGSLLITTLANQSKIIEQGELLKHIEALESKRKSETKAREAGSG